MTPYIFTVLAIDEKKRSYESKYGFKFEIEVIAHNADEARKIGIGKFCEKYPDEDIKDYITDVASA